MNVSSTRRVPVVDRHNNLIDPADVKSGDYGRANINAFGYSGEARGVTFGLNLVQFLREGAPLGGGISVAAAFGHAGSSAGCRRDARAVPTLRR